MAIIAGRRHQDGTTSLPERDVMIRSAESFELEGAVCVVTGASSGLGRRFALDLAAAGAVVTGLARRDELLQTLQVELRSLSHRSQASQSRALRCDVSDVGSFVEVLEGIESANGRIDVLVNCAGIGEPAGDVPVGDVPARGSAGPDMLASYRAVMETNYFAAVAGTLAVLPGMLERRHGAIVNVSSDSARAPGPGEPAYCASKSALSAFTECQALSNDGSGVHIHVLYPGWVPTAMGNEAIERGMPMPPRFVRRSEERVSRLLISRLGSRRIDIDAAPIARMAPVARSLAPGAYKRGVLKTSGYGDN
jgi:NAD(P)-dependent dehydrogenase (short-subunit alcohol dehydrogenase family)